MSNCYILDTNVLLHDPNALFAFQENEVILPLAVVEEVDNQKKRQDEIGRNARVVSQKLDALRVHGNLAEGVTLPTGGRLRIELNHQECHSLPAALDTHKFDNRILAVAHYFNHRRGRPDGPGDQRLEPAHQSRCAGDPGRGLSVGKGQLSAVV